MSDTIKKIMRSICNDCVTIIDTTQNNFVCKNHDFDVDDITGIGRCRKCGMVLIMTRSNWGDFFTLGKVAVKKGD